MSVLTAETRHTAPLGATLTGEGVNFSVFSKHATRIELLLFDDALDRRPSRVIPLDARQHRTYHYWHIFVPNLAPGQIYACMHAATQNDDVQESSSNSKSITSTIDVVSDTSHV